ncbi:MAG: T9SS type A sorting domain-containing protein [candidate division KSB1 bacterium]|nr:T9SS type A sorting domain-containing protein [candidate division KSB1 bacterium]
MMTFNKILLSVLCVGLVIGLNVIASANEITRPDSILLVPKAAVAPVIDGRIDDVWECVGNTYQNYYRNGPSLPDDKTDLMGWYRVMWDDNYFYGLFFTVDEVLWDTNTDPWTNDSWEIYFDSNYSRASAYDGLDDNQIRFEHKDKAAADIDAAGWFNKTGVVFVNKDTLNGYILEFKIPMDDIKLDPAPGTIFGWETQQNDADGPSRNHISKWWLKTGDNSWNNPSVFGTAMLVDTEVDGTLPVFKTPTPPVIDAELEDLWFTNSWEFSMNSYTNGPSLPENYDDLEGEYRVMWDDDYFYGFFITKDEVMWDTNTDPWTNDSWEIYFDSNYSRASAYDGLDDNQIRFEHKDKVAADIDAAGWFNKSGVVFAQKDTPDGYVLEFKIPMDDIKLDAAEGTIFGWETQQNDNDSGAREAISKWHLDVGDNSWNNPSVFGSAMLRGPLAVGVKEKPPVARDFALSQNYPNPFNPGTTITYSLKSNGKVRLSVYDLMGREVAVLVNGVQSAGKHEVTFSGANLPSGVYLYKLQTANEVITKKMALVR